MKTIDYVRLASVSKTVLIWMSVFGFISSYLSFTGKSLPFILIVMAVYFTVCGIYVFITREKYKKKQMAYVVHPLAFGPMLAAFFISALENDGKNMTFLSVYLIFLNALYLTNCYLSSYAVILTGASENKANIMVKYAGKRNTLFVIWVAAFMLCAFLVLLIPEVNARLELNLNLNSQSGGEYTEQPIETDEGESDGNYEESKGNSFFIAVLTFFIVVSVAAIVFLARKIIYRDDKPDKYDRQLPEDIEEEVIELAKQKEKKSISEDVSGTAKQRVRKHYSKAVKGYYPEKVDASRTPYELLNSGNDKENALNSIYEAAMYSDEEVTMSDAKLAKELSGELVRGVGKNQKRGTANTGD